MKLIKLEILNLASLDRPGGEIIDFEQGALKDSTIFSIVGPTGSGKSTILDAICLALYNRAPRYPRKKGDRNQNIEIYGDLEEGEKNRLAPTDSRNILTRGKKEGFSKLTFLANNGFIYRAEWYVKFNRTKFDNVISSLYKLTTHERQPTEEIADWNELPQIIGLDYDQFLRTVLIAQGSFANFLTAKENERYELLEKLIGCEELYTGISNKIKIKKDEAIQAYTEINAHFQAFEKDILPDEELETLHVRIKELEAEEKKAKELLLKTNEALQWYVIEATHQQNITTFKENKAQVEKAQEEAKPQIERLNLHDSTLPAISYYKSMKEAEANINKTTNEMIDLEAQIVQCDLQIKKGESILNDLKTTETRAQTILEEQKPHINRAHTIKGELDIACLSVKEKEETQKTSETAHQKAKDEVNSNRHAIDKAEEVFQQMKKAYALLKDEIEQQKQELAEEVKQRTEAFQTENKVIESINADQLQKDKEQADQKKFDLKEAIRIQEDYHKKQASLQECKELQQKLTERNLQITEDLGKFTIDELQKEVETLKKTYTLMTSENWSTHRQNLEEGKPCPLCGATHHPYQKDENLAPVVNELQEMITSKEKTLNEQIELRNNRKKEQGENLGKLQSIEKNIHSYQEELNKLQAEWADIHQKHADWPADVEKLKAMQPAVIDEVESISNSLKNYHAKVNQVNELRKKKETIEKKQATYIDEAEKKLRDAEQKQNEAEIHLKTEAGKTENLIAQEKEKEVALNLAISNLKEAQKIREEKILSLQAEIGDKDPDELEQTLMKAKQDATEAFEHEQQKIIVLREERKTMDGKKEAMNHALSEKKQTLTNHQKSLDAWLKDFKPQLTSEDIAALYESTDNWEEIRKKQTELLTAFTTAQTTLKNEEDALAKHQEKKPAESKEELTSRKAELENMSNAELTDSKARWQRHIHAKEQMGSLFEQRQASALLKDEWEDIAEAIGGDGKTLRKIAQCYTLHFLIEHANVEIRKFNNRYELQQVKNSLGIRVIDHDRADDVRDTTSLSGGETFIVSLGLALGLSALSSRNISFENLFIDEGFGTLDPDTLATVIDSLAMLQSSQGKKVGVISHTDTMSERITTQIRIIKNGNSGSSHIEIYP